VVAEGFAIISGQSGENSIIGQDLGGIRRRRNPSSRKVAFV